VTTESRMSRRRFAELTGGMLAPFVFGGACRLESQAGSDGRLSARPTGSARTSAQGTRPLGLDAGRDGLLQLPAKPADAPLPLLVLLHGAGGSGERLLRRFSSAADERSIAIVAPDSRGQTWDAIRDGFGPDVPFLNRVLQRVFETVAVDPERVAVGGFSDGASYALSLGLINGDLFRRVAAFSPGFVVDGSMHGRPRVFISHGIADQILPIDQCSRRIVAALKRRGYDVTFHEFNGGHEMPTDVVNEAMTWLVAV
jgi:phospholipase/carboxylesterase